MSLLHATDVGDAALSASSATLLHVTVVAVQPMAGEQLLYKVHVLRPTLADAAESHDDHVDTLLDDALLDVRTLAHLCAHAAAQGARRALPTSLNSSKLGATQPLAHVRRRARLAELVARWRIEEQQKTTTDTPRRSQHGVVPHAIAHVLFEKRAA